VTGLPAVDLDAFVVSARFGELRPGASTQEIVGLFGEPDTHEPARRSTPAALLYGGVELWLRADRLASVAFTLPPDRPLDAGPIDVTGLWPPQARTLEAITGLLAANGVAWARDEVMSSILADRGRRGGLPPRRLRR
jgi:hypothetical protein